MTASNPRKASRVQKGQTNFIRSDETLLLVDNIRPAPSIALEHRRSLKPMMEKRRRARINDSLNQLQTLLEQLQQPAAKAQKLEKADILELTVQYLQTLKQKQQQPQRPELLLNKFRAGFRQCRRQVDDCFRTMQLQPALADRVTSHLAQFEDQQLVQLNDSDNVPLNLSVYPRQPLNLTINTDVKFVQSPLNSLYTFSSGSLSPGSDRSVSPSLSASTNDSIVWRPW